MIIIGESSLIKLVNTIWRKEAYFVVTNDGDMRGCTISDLLELDVASSLIVDSKPHEDVKSFKTAIAEAVSGMICLTNLTDNKKYNICLQIHSILKSPRKWLNV